MIISTAFRQDSRKVKVTRPRSDCASYVLPTKQQLLRLGVERFPHYRNPGPAQKPPHTAEMLGKIGSLTQHLARRTGQTCIEWLAGWNTLQHNTLEPSATRGAHKRKPETVETHGVSRRARVHVEAYCAPTVWQRAGAPSKPSSAEGMERCTPEVARMKASHPTCRPSQPCSLPHNRKK